AMPAPARSAAQTGLTGYNSPVATCWALLFSTLTESWPLGWIPLVHCSRRVRAASCRGAYPLAKLGFPSSFDGQTLQIGIDRQRREVTSGIEFVVSPRYREGETAPQVRRSLQKPTINFFKKVARSALTVVRSLAADRILTDDFHSLLGVKPHHLGLS